MLKYTVNNTLTISEALRALLSRARKGFPASWGRAWFPGSDVLLFNYARSAMKSAILGLGLQGKEIITPAFVCKELADVFAQTKTRPVFVDADPRTWNMDIRAIPKKLTKRTGAVLAVHTFGNPLPMKELLKLQKEHGFHIIEDCAQALGTRYQGKLAGSFGDAAFFSIYKMFPTISGGILVINNPRIRPPRPTHPERFGLEGLARLLYSINILYPLLSGLKPRKPSSMTPAPVIKQPPGPVQALMEHFLASAKPEINKRNALAGIYEKELKGFRLQKTEPRGWPSRISFPVCLESRDRALAEMRKAGILCDRVWHDPIIYAKKVRTTYKVNPADYPNTEALSRTILNLPLHARYSKEDVRFITRQLASISKHRPSFGRKASLTTKIEIWNKSGINLKINA